MELVELKASKKESFVPTADLLQRHEALFKTYYKPLVVYATKMIRDREDAEDLVQEIFAQIWKKKDELQYDKGISSYLFGAVKNACYNNTRHMQVVQRYEEYAKNTREVIDDPHHYMMLNEIEQKIEETLNKLPPKSKEVFLLSRFKQQKNKEIAALMNISIKTVELHLSNTLAALRGSLKHYLKALILIIINLHL